MPHSHNWSSGDALEVGPGCSASTEFPALGPPELSSSQAEIFSQDSDCSSSCLTRADSICCLGEAARELEAFLGGSLPKLGLMTCFGHFFFWTEDGSNLVEPCNRPYVHDFSQNPSVVKKYGTSLPTLLRNSYFWSQRLARLCLPDETFLMQGFPVPGLAAAVVGALLVLWMCSQNKKRGSCPAT